MNGLVNELIGILLGAVMEYVPEVYREEVLAIATPVYVGVLFIFTFIFLIWCAGVAVKTFFKE